MARVALLLGGNSGEVKRTLQQAQRLINARVGAVMRCSNRYESEPWGFRAAQPFFNQALEISTDLAPREVLDAVARIETELGRNRAAEQIEKAATGARYASRPIDIDIIFYGSEVIDEPQLQIPHPRMAERTFVLTPLNEIMRSFRHPVTGLTVGEMLAALRAAETAETAGAAGTAAARPAEAGTRPAAARPAETAEPAAAQPVSAAETAETAESAAAQQPAATAENPLRR